MEIVKRIAPFFLTFALGLAIASIFVTVAAPNFNFKRGKKHQECKRVKVENERLQKRVEFLERRNAQLESERFDVDSSFEGSFTIPAPPAPIAPKSIR